jgi:hypothetical protein
LAGAREAGFDNDLWTCRRVAQLIVRRFGVFYHADHTGRLLHGLGWSPQKPQRRAAERDEEAVRTWLKKDWPRIKKNPAAEGFSALRRSPTRLLLCASDRTLLIHGSIILI